MYIEVRLEAFAGQTSCVSLPSTPVSLPDGKIGLHCNHDLDKYRAAAHYESWYLDENARSINPFQKLRAHRRRLPKEDDGLEPTQAATVQKEEDTDPQRPLTTPSTWNPGKELETIDEERRASENQSDVAQEHPAPHKRLGAFFTKTKENDDEDLERVDISSRTRSQNTFWHRCLCLAGLRNARSIRAPMAGIGASVNASGPWGTSARSVRVDILDFDRDNESKNGNHRARSWTLDLWRLIVRKSH